jgi:hypothetical protein
MRKNTLRVCIRASVYTRARLGDEIAIGQQDRAGFLVCLDPHPQVAARRAELSSPERERGLEKGRVYVSETVGELCSAERNTRVNTRV